MSYMKWSHMKPYEPYDTLRSSMNLMKPHGALWALWSGFLWSPMSLIKWILVEPYEPYKAFWSSMKPYGALWAFKNGALWNPMSLIKAYGVSWDRRAADAPSKGTLGCSRTGGRQTNTEQESIKKTAKKMYKAIFITEQYGAQWDLQLLPGSMIRLVKYVAYNSTHTLKFNMLWSIRSQICISKWCRWKKKSWIFHICFALQTLCCMPFAIYVFMQKHICVIL